MRITISDGGDLKRAAAALRRAANAKQLRAELLRGLRAELNPAVRAVKGAYGGGRHLRPALSRATRGEIRTGGRDPGVRVRVDGRRMPDRMGSLPSMYEGWTRWRHPLFGNRDHWYTQPPHPTFYRTVKPFEARVQRQIERVADDVINKIVKG